MNTLSRTSPTALVQSDQVEVRIAKYCDDSDEDEIDTEVQSQPLKLEFDSKVENEPAAPIQHIAAAHNKMQELAKLL